MYRCSNCGTSFNLKKIQSTNNTSKSKTKKKNSTSTRKSATKATK